MTAQNAPTLEDLLTGEPSREAWTALCALLAGLEGDALAEALALASGLVRDWPASVRSLRLVSWSKDPEAPWMRGVFEGRFDPRLGLAGHARLEHTRDFVEEGELVGPDFVGGMFPIARAFAQHLVPGFAPPEEVCFKDGEYFSAGSCGGGFDEQKRGDEAQGFRWHDQITEHAADDSSTGAWTPYGLPWDGTFHLGRYERGRGHYYFVAWGPTPAVFELACAWGQLVSAGEVVTQEHARRALEQSRALRLAQWPTWALS